MAIFKPGERHRYHNILKRRGKGRSITAALSLTAMVDMFTVLVIFLLQAYSSDPVVLVNPESINLPKAEQTKQLKPAAVVTVSKENIYIEKVQVATMEEVRASVDWILPKMRDELIKLLQAKKLEYDSQIRNQVQSIIGNEPSQPPQQLDWKKITIQADKDVNYLAVKKIMYTISSAGAGQINFAVMKKDDAAQPSVSE